MRVRSIKYYSKFRYGLKWLEIRFALGFRIRTGVLNRKLLKRYISHNTIGVGYLMSFVALFLPDRLYFHFSWLLPDGPKNVCSFHTY